ncbi:MAG: hypothetical protein U0792_19825 [Gemmataceae bacterium]
MFTRVLAVLVVGTALNREVSAREDGVTLTVVPSSTNILVDDPVVFKGVLKHGGKPRLLMLRSFETFTGGVRIEVCPPDSKEFAKVSALGDGLFCGICKSWYLEPGSTMACYFELFRAPVQGMEVQAFSYPGKWRVRIYTLTEGEDPISEAVTILVTPRPKREQEALLEAEVPIHFCLRYRGSEESDQLVKALKYRDILAPSAASRAITQAEVLRALQGASAARARTFALAEVKKHRDQLSPVEREFFDLETAEIHFQRKEFADAKRLLDAIPEASYRRNNLLARVRIETEK